MLQELEVRRYEECISSFSNGKSRDSQSVSSTKADMIVEVEKTYYDLYYNTRLLVEKNL